MAMLTQHGLKLAVDIIINDFGKLVAQVCECLLRRGSLTRSGIAKFTELPSEKIKQCLFVLMQHNCVQAFVLEQEGGSGESMTVRTHYMALFDNIIHRMRFPKFLAIVSKEFDKDCAELLDCLLQHGRLKMTQIFDRSMEHSDEGNNAIQDAFREKFFQLVKSRYVEHCPAPEPLIALPTEEESAPKKKKAKSDKLIQKEVTLEEHALAASLPMEAERFFIDAVNGDDTEEAKKGKGFPSTKSAKKRKHELLDVENEFDIKGCEQEPHWRVNFDEFKRKLRNKACIENTRARLDDGAGIVLSAMLEASKSTENTVSVSLDSIFEEVLKSKEGCIMTLEHIRSYIVQLGCRSVEDELYSIDLKKIIEQARNEEVESIVLKRYGKEAYRMFRLLSTNGRPLDTDKISDGTFVEKKETTRILYKMWKDNYLEMEKATVVGRPGEFFLWRVKKNVLSVQVLDELYHAALNLRFRLSHELEKSRELVGLKKHNLVGELAERHERLRKVYTLLKSSLTKLDDAILLFHDFSSAKLHLIQSNNASNVRQISCQIFSSQRRFFLPSSSPFPLSRPFSTSSEAATRTQKLERIADELLSLNKLERYDYSILFRLKLGLNNFGPSSLSGPLDPSASSLPGSAAAAGDKPSEKTAFDVKLEKFDAAAKIKVIKEVRSFTDLGLKEAKDLVEKTPVIVKKGVTKEEGESILQKLKELGATVVLE
ncbi:hypothetical protein Nepgr_020236 [Nepenthes gracilis]|uniref:DNA-directed RNA polymerase III subunit RPC3 n=1 Tax=Nepenthes gracilis TaxID=150966 RepID=A0AAD3SV14_NEPGR|nr:hypothetical protein Nepgr_020236 [Nepenthes gracilis]